ncbi:uncharacterized protein LOC132552668 [Ylistrum balloti]|uniref:uncharacterized protein LOC132552668 n=1 Tax=Ylistrum balloti TaxID=509963 RepID=UPI0029058E80|nr:uncharacterized protein LOC132552668 [Ylistrum balloti]
MTNVNINEHSIEDNFHYGNANFRPSHKALLGNHYGHGIRLFIIMPPKEKKRATPSSANQPPAKRLKRGQVQPPPSSLFSPTVAVVSGNDSTTLNTGSPMDPTSPIVPDQDETQPGPFHLPMTYDVHHQTDVLNAPVLCSVQHISAYSISDENQARVITSPAGNFIVADSMYSDPQGATAAPQLILEFHVSGEDECSSLLPSAREICSMVRVSGGDECSSLLPSAREIGPLCLKRTDVLLFSLVPEEWVPWSKMISRKGSLNPERKCEICLENLISIVELHDVHYVEKMQRYVCVLLCGKQNPLHTWTGSKRTLIKLTKTSAFKLTRNMAAPDVTTKYKASVTSKGEFVRCTSVFRDWITADGSSGFKSEAGRYHLYVSLACPWAHRTLIVRKLKGLEQTITYDVVDWLLDGEGWSFTDKKPDCTLDTVNGCSRLREVYRMANPDDNSRITVPVLWDKQRKTIVNNESSEIIRMLNSEFNAFCTTEEQRKLDLYPEHIRTNIDGLNEWIYPMINNGVYRSGFATSQEAYDVAVRELFQGLDRAENILSKTRYLTGSELTEADIRLFTTLIRFDLVYVGHFKCNRKRIVDFPNLWGYLRDLYQLRGIADTVNFEHITKHYMMSHAMINPTRIVSIGPDIDFTTPHGRESMSKS